jgi:hypothetical protein
MRLQPTNTLEGLGQFDRQLWWAVYLLNEGRNEMSLARLQKLADQAQRMRTATDKASVLADSTDQTLTSFEQNLEKLEAARLKVREHDNQITSMLKVMGNFDVDKTLGEDGGAAGPPSSASKAQTDINGVTLNPEAKSG